MTLKVIGTGLGRTGTHSTRLALNQLGFPCYHMVEVIVNKDNKTHLDFWPKVANSPPGSEQDWNQVFAKLRCDRRLSRLQRLARTDGRLSGRESAADAAPKGSRRLVRKRDRDDLLLREHVAVQGARAPDSFRAKIRRYDR